MLPFSRRGAIKNCSTGPCITFFLHKWDFRHDNEAENNLYIMVLGCQRCSETKEWEWNVLIEMFWVLTWLQLNDLDIQVSDTFSRLWLCVCVSMYVSFVDLMANIILQLPNDTQFNIQGAAETMIVRCHLLCSHPTLRFLSDFFRCRIERWRLCVCLCVWSNTVGQPHL